MAGIKMQWTCFVVMVAAVRSQDSYGSPTSAVLSPSSTFPGSSSSFSPSPSQSNFQPSNFQTIIGGPSPNSFSGSSSSGSSTFGNTFQDFNRGFSTSSEPELNIDISSSSTNSFSGSSLSNSFGSNSVGSSFGSSSGGSSFSTGNSGRGSSSNAVDFSQATRTADGRLCVIKEESVETLSKDPILECKHKNIEKCHYTYITFFKPAQEETCEENFEKSCQITF